MKRSGFAGHVGGVGIAPSLVARLAQEAIRGEDVSMSGRRERFERIYDSCHAPVLGYVRRRTASIDDAHDVVSEIFLAAWRRLDQIPEGDRARLWLFGTARKVLANHHRGGQRSRRLTERIQRESGHVRDHSDVGVGAGETALIAAAFGRLSEPDREVLILAGWEQLDPGQIAQVLGCTRANARLRLHRARRRFAAALADQGLDPAARLGADRSRRTSVRPGSEEAT